MTNEEMAVEIQAGRMGYGELWEQVHRFVRQQASKYYLMHGGTCTHAGLEFDDLMQCGFLAMYDAVKAFDAGAGYQFLTYFKYPLLNRFREACGIRTSRRDPLNNCASLNKPVGEEGEDELEELVPDHGAVQDMEAALEREYRRELRKALDTALDTLTERQRDTLRRRYWNRETLDAIAEDIQLSRERVRQTEAKALRTLRHCRYTPLLRSFANEMRVTYAWQGTGFRSWKNTGASSVERAAEKLDAIEKRAGL